MDRKVPILNFLALYSISVGQQTTAEMATSFYMIGEIPHLYTVLSSMALGVTKSSLRKSCKTNMLISPEVRT